MKIIFGPSVDTKTGNLDELLKNIESALEFSDNAIELCLTRTRKVIYDKSFTDLLKKFKYKSVHLPVIDGENFINYPDLTIEPKLKLIDKIIEDIDPNVVLVHPDQIRDFSWIKSRYGKYLAFENMDSKKASGRSIEDMEKVFDICPEAKWVFDVNHVYTNDQSMEISSIFYDRFKEKLTHYHLSGYGGFHDALCISKEDVILKGIKSLDYPIIDEGDLLLKNVLSQEYDYVCERLMK